MNTNNAESTSLEINEHDFQTAKDALKKYAVKSDSELAIPPVRSSGGLFHLGDHHVTGDELNKVTSQIQEYLIDSNKLAQEFIDEFGQVYKAFESLDKDYISGIVASIKAAEKVSIEEQKDRADIRKIVERLDKSVDVLTKFRASAEQKYLKQEALETTRAELFEQIYALSDLLEQQEQQNLEAKRTQADELSRISQEQKYALEAMSKAQNDQNESMVAVVNTLETEKASLKETTEMMKRKLKTAYIIAGSAAVLTVIHLVLNIVGVL